MTTYAHVVDGIVQRLYEPPPEFAEFALNDLMAAEIAAQMVRLTATQAKRVLPGWTHDGTTFAAPPEVPVEPPPPRPISAREFRQRWTPGERAAVTLAAHLAMQADPPDPTLRVFLDDLLATQEVDLAHPELAAGVDACIAAGLIDANRRDELLA